MDRQIISFDMFGEPSSCQRNTMSQKCGCPKNKWGGTAVDELPLARVYGPMQKFTGACDPEEGLMTGTIFRELNKPFCGKRVR